MLTIILSFVIMFLMVMVIVVFFVIQKRKAVERETEYQMNFKNKELEVLKRLIETQESEREKIAHNLHDEVNPLISAIKFHLKRYEILLEQGNLSKQDLVEESKFIDRIINNMRSVTQDLSPNFLLRNGLVDAIRSYLFDLNVVTVTIEEEVDDQVLVKPDIALNVYRCFLEIVNNIMKHDSPSKLDLHIHLENSSLELNLTHDGQGITNEDFVHFSEASEGLGLSSLKTRKTLLNAELDYQIEPISTVRFTIPLTSEKKN